MTGPLAPLFAQLGGTLDFLREIENGMRCGTCQRPHATDDDWQRYDEGDGEHLCWETVCSHDPESPTALERLTESRAALSAIERHLHDMETALEQIMDHIEENDWDIPGTFHSYAQNKSASLVWIRDVARAALSAAPTATHQETK